MKKERIGKGGEKRKRKAPRVEMKRGEERQREERNRVTDRRSQDTGP